MKRLALRALAMGVFVSACGIDLARPPVARITLAPTAVPADDQYATPVTLDGTASGDDLADPPRALTYQWSVNDPTARFDGPSSAPTAILRIAGTTPPEVTLTVTTTDGRSASASAVLAITEP